MKPTSSKFNPGDLFNLFLITAFLPHVWTILMALRDVGWVAEDRLISGAIGYSAYVLFFTLLESIALFGFLLLLGLLISKKWSKKQRLVSLGLISMILSGWSILEQIILVLLYDRIVHFLLRFGFLGMKPWIGFIILGVLVLISFAIPVYFVLKSTKVTKIINEIFDRLTLLSGMYLFLDVIAIVIILIRNLS